MKYSIFILLLGVTLGCSIEDAPERAGQSQEALTGALSPQGFLTIKGVGVGLTSDEFEREQTTLGIPDSYYAWANDGSHAPLVSLTTLADFRSTYGFGTGVTEAQAFYYNRGDLGLGREMHCVDTMETNGQVACYVTNFAAGDADTEYTFGLGSGFAFENMKFPSRAVATVAMFYQKNTSVEHTVGFFVYDGAGNLTNNAPLDRHGLNFQQAFASSVASLGYQAGVNPPPEFGVPGVNLNNHIPTNCLNCHGGVFQPNPPPGQVGPSPKVHTRDASFLPWDLDQFEFEQAPGRTRADQEDQFRLLNQIARKVAFSQRVPGAAPGIMGLSSPIVQQIDAWYNNTSHSATLSGTFQSTAASATQNGIIDQWNSATFLPGGIIVSSAANRSLFYNVVRKCRGCHIASSIPTLQFNTPRDFLDLAPAIAADLKSHRMPHALQAQREFWLSGQAVEIANYFRNHGAAAAADVIDTAGPDDIVLLDPPAIVAAVF
jgi:hypothetical protein